MCQPICLELSWTLFQSIILTKIGLDELKRPNFWGAYKDTKLI